MRGGLPWIEPPACGRQSSGSLPRAGQVEWVVKWGAGSPPPTTAYGIPPESTVAPQSRHPRFRKAQPGPPLGVRRTETGA